MKKTVSLFIITAMLCVFAACGNSAEPTASTTPTNSTSIPVQSSSNTEKTTVGTSAVMSLYNYTKHSPYCISWGESAYAFRNTSWSVSTNAISYSELIDSAEKMPFPNNISESDEANSILSRFDENFFKTHSILYLHLNFTSGSIYPENIYITRHPENAYDITIVPHRPYIQTCDMATWTVIIVLDKYGTENVPEINVSVK